MNDDKAEHDSKHEPEPVEWEIESINWRIKHDPNDPLEIFSKGFEADLRRILGDRYLERSKST